MTAWYVLHTVFVAGAVQVAQPRKVSHDGGRLDQVLAVDFQEWDLGMCTNTCTRGEGSTTNSGAEHTSTHLAEHELSAVAERLHILRRPQEHVVPAIRPHHNRQRQADDSGTALHE